MADTAIYNFVANDGEIVPVKAIDNGDGTYSLSQTNGSLRYAEASFSRPNNATPYSISDAVNDSTSAPTLMTLTDIARTIGGTGYIVKARLGTNQSTCTAQLRAYIHTVSNPTISNDNSPFVLAWANKSNRIGCITFPALATEGTGSDCAFANWETQGSNGVVPYITGSSKDLYINLETLSAFTPASGQAFYLEVWAEAN
jgi:hypothetical protein